MSYVCWTLQHSDNLISVGKLFLVATPIGNLKDITLRALETLKQVDFVLAEDTRKSGQLLKHYEIEAKFIPFHQHNEHNILEAIITRLKEGQQLALVSDAGMPGISDPGFLLVRACIQHKIEIECLAGANAFLPALLLSGFPTDRFCFEGFLPHKKGRQSRLRALEQEERSMIFYESPHRLKKLLVELKETFGQDRAISVSREISKLFEESIRGDIASLIEHFSKTEPKGEFVVVVKGSEA